MASVLVLNQYFAPDPVQTARHVSAICRRLARDGHSVTAVVGQPSYLPGLASEPARETVSGVEVIRVDLGRRTGRGSIVRRIVGYARYLAGAWWRSRGFDPDLVICFHNPPLVPLIAASVAKRTGARMLYVIQDVHPDIVVAARRPSLPSAAVRLWERANRRMLAAADRIVVLGEGMKETLTSGKGVSPDRVDVIPPWPDPELSPREPDPGWRRDHGVADDELLVVYAGNLGIMHPLDRLLEAARNLADRPVRFMVVGNGVRRDHWISEAAASDLRRLAFLDHLPDEEFNRLLAAADLCFVALSQGMERFAVPSRGLAFLSAGRPVIADMAPAADLVRVLRETGAGWGVSSADELTDLVTRLIDDRSAIRAAGEQARRAYEERFRGELVLDRYAGLVDELLS